MKRTIKRLQALLLALAMCTSVLQATAFAAESSDADTSAGHKYVITGVEFDKDGKYVATRTCEAHGDEAAEQLKGTANVKGKTEATCTKPATVTYIVTFDNVNGKSEWESDPFETAPAKGHGELVDTPVLVKAPTCTEEGTYRIDKVCSVCGDTVKKGEEQKSQMVRHQFETVTNPDGTTVEKCKVCGQVKPNQETCDHYVLIEPEIENVVAPDCKKGKDGSHDEVEYCQKCDKVMSRKNVVDKAEHKAGKPEELEKSRVEPTCAKEGSVVMVTKCEVCGTEIKRETKTLDKVAHSKAKEPVYENDTADCQKAGTRDEVYKCVICGQDFSRQTVDSPKKAHKKKDPVKENVVDPTCTKEGSYDTVIYCAVGGEEMSREKVTVEKLPHKTSPAIVWEKDYYGDTIDTLYGTETPYADVKDICTVCGSDEGYVDDATIKEDKDKATSGAFDCQPGSKTFTASYTYKEKGKDVTISDTKTFKYYPSRKHASHTPGAATIENKVEPTCTEDGKYDVIVRCTVCNDILSTTPGVTGKTGHVPGKVVIENAKDATCSAAGSHDEVIYCSDCGEELSRKSVDDKATAHTPGKAVKENVTDTSYDEVIKCSVCGQEISRKTIKTEKPVEPEPAKPHTHTAGKAKKKHVVKATYDRSGSYDLITYCTECGQIMSVKHKTVAQKVLKGSKLKSVKNVKGKKIKGTWTKVSGVDGYQFQYCLNKHFLNHKVIDAKKKLTKTTGKLKKGKKYYVRVRTYKKVGNKRYFSVWSKYKTVTIKK